MPDPTFVFLRNNDELCTALLNCILTRLLIQYINNLFIISKFMKLDKIVPKFVNKSNPRIGLITLGSDFRNRALKQTFINFIPSAYALHNTSFFVREMIGRAYYKLKY